MYIIINWYLFLPCLSVNFLTQTSKSLRLHVLSAVNCALMLLKSFKSTCFPVKDTILSLIIFLFALSESNIFTSCFSSMLNFLCCGSKSKDSYKIGVPPYTYVQKNSYKIL